MRVVTVAELETSLDDCLARASQGEEIIVIEDGEPFARIIACETDEDGGCSVEGSES